jgi:membrane protein DedA with SNARE-associated domain
MNKIAEIMNGALSAILIAIGYAALWCGIFCLIGWGVGDNSADMFGGIQMCAMGCLIFSVILLGSGIAWYYIVKSKS